MFHWSATQSIALMAGGLEVVAALFVGREAPDLSSGVPALIAGSCGGFSDRGPERRERALDGVRGGRIRRQEQGRGADGAQGCYCVGSFVARQGVEDDRVARAQR